MLRISREMGKSICPSSFRVFAELVLKLQDTLVRYPYSVYAYPCIVESSSASDVVCPAEAPTP